MIPRTFRNRLASLLLLLPALVACGDGRPAVMTSAADVGRYLVVDTGVQAMQAQRMTLPEAGGLVPGPTDYVALVASIRLAPDALRQTLARLAPYTGDRRVPEPFTRPAWMPVRERAVLSAATTGAVPVYDASPFVVGKALRAWTTPVDNVLLVYVEYMAP